MCLKAGTTFAVGAPVTRTRAAEERGMRKNWKELERGAWSGRGGEDFRRGQSRDQEGGFQSRGTA